MGKTSRDRNRPEFDEWEKLDVRITHHSWYGQLVSRIPEEKILGALAMISLGYTLLRGVAPEGPLDWPRAAIAAVVSVSMVVLALLS